MPMMELLPTADTLPHLHHGSCSCTACTNPWVPQTATPGSHISRSSSVQPASPEHSTGSQAALPTGSAGHAPSATPTSSNASVSTAYIRKLAIGCVNTAPPGVTPSAAHSATSHASSNSSSGNGSVGHSTPGRTSPNPLLDDISAWAPQPMSPEAEAIWAEVDPAPPGSYGVPNSTTSTPRAEALTAAAAEADIVLRDVLADRAPAGQPEELQVMVSGLHGAGCGAAPELHQAPAGAGSSSSMQPASPGNNSASSQAVMPAGDASYPLTANPTSSNASVSTAYIRKLVIPQVNAAPAAGGSSSAASQVSSNSSSGNATAGHSTPSRSTPGPLLDDVSAWAPKPMSPEAEAIWAVVNPAPPGSDGVPGSTASTPRAAAITAAVAEADIVLRDVLADRAPAVQPEELQVVVSGLAVVDAAPEAQEAPAGEGSSSGLLSGMESLLQGMQATAADYDRTAQQLEEMRQQDEAAEQRWQQQAVAAEQRWQQLASAGSAAQEGAAADNTTQLLPTEAANNSVPSGSTNNQAAAVQPSTTVTPLQSPQLRIKVPPSLQDPDLQYTSPCSYSVCTQTTPRSRHGGNTLQFSRLQFLLVLLLTAVSGHLVIVGLKSAAASHPPATFGMMHNAGGMGSLYSHTPTWAPGGLEGLVLLVGNNSYDIPGSSSMQQPRMLPQVIAPLQDMARTAWLQVSAGCSHVWQQSLPALMQHTQAAASAGISQLAEQHQFLPASAAAVLSSLGDKLSEYAQRGWAATELLRAWTAAAAQHSYGRASARLSAAVQAMPAAPSSSGSSSSSSSQAKPFPQSARSGVGNYCHHTPTKHSWDAALTHIKGLQPSEGMRHQLDLLDQALVRLCA